MSGPVTSTKDTEERVRRFVDTFLYPESRAVLEGYRTTRGGEPVQEILSDFAGEIGGNTEPSERWARFVRANDIPAEISGALYALGLRETLRLDRIAPESLFVLATSKRVLDELEASSGWKRHEHNIEINRAGVLRFPAR
jgi:dsDNA-specific endonuclease/ATPase MutS2